jgi:hypothetical protein
MLDARSIDPVPADAGLRRVVFDERSATVVKYQDVERTRIELLKTTLGAEIGRATSLFRTASIVAHDPAAGSITFERLVGYCNLQQALSASPLPGRLVARVARSLAAIHDRLALPAGDAIPLPPLDGVELRSPPVFIHGDFGTENILYNAARDDLVIVDWSAADWLADGTQGPRSVDLTILLQSLFTRRPFGVNPIPQAARLGRTFLETYWSEAREPPPADEFHRHFRALVAAFVATCGREKGWRFLAYRPSLIQAQRVVRRFCRDVADIR